MLGTVTDLQQRSEVCVRVCVCPCVFSHSFIGLAFPAFRNGLSALPHLMTLQKGPPLQRILTNLDINETHTHTPLYC